MRDDFGSGCCEGPSSTECFSLFRDLVSRLLRFVGEACDLSVCCIESAWSLVSFRTALSFLLNTDRPRSPSRSASVLRRILESTASARMDCPKVFRRSRPLRCNPSRHAMSFHALIYFRPRIFPRTSPTSHQQSVFMQPSSSRRLTRSLPPHFALDLIVSITDDGANCMFDELFE